MSDPDSKESIEVNLDGRKLALRALSVSDIERLHRLDLICFTPERAFTQGYFSILFLYNNAFGWALEDERGEMAAFILVTIQRNRGNISTIDVHPDFRRLGLGQRLMSLAEENLRQMGMKKCTLQVAVDNNSAIKLYEKLGYKITRTLPGYYEDKQDAYLMEKSLADPAPSSENVV
jgi:ribosomal-protein-alanine N-acetyltransferase